VSRTPLFAVAFSVAFAFRRVLKRGFVPFVAFIVVAWCAYALGFFESSAARFAQRGLVESGRLLVWPLAFQRILEAPLAGVGVQHVATFVPLAGVRVSPHNSFIFLALASGVVPFLFFAGYWVQLFVRTFRSAATSHGEASFESSLLVYSFLIAMSLGGAFQLPWMMATLAVVRVRTLASRTHREVRAPRVGSRVVTSRRGGDAFLPSQLASSRGHGPSVL
jgi:O-antigen ligase